jgi:hypothetical protein
MAGKPKWDYPADEELLALAKTHRSVSALAKALGIPRPTLAAHVDKQNLGSRLQEVWLQPVDEAGVSREEMLEQELAEARKAAREARSDDIREQRMIQAITDNLATKTPRYKPLKLNGSKTSHKAHTLELQWSDLHAAEVVSEDETGGANAYNWDIMLSRHDELRRGVLSFRDRFGPVEELVILGLGDMLSGNIHDELEVTNEMPLSEATVQLGLDGAEFIESLVPEFPAIRFAGVVGNHPRPTHKMRSKGRYDNADWTCYQIMRQRLSRHESVSFEIPKAQKHPVLVYGKRLLALHGDGIRSSMVGVPWGGIIRHTDRLRNQYAQMAMPVDHFCLGHYHEANAVKNRRILMNGSVKGVDEYSLDAFGGGEPPTQLLLPFHPDWGLVGIHYIDLQV